MDTGATKTLKILGKILLVLGIVYLVIFLLSFFGLSTRLDPAAALVSFFDEHLTPPPFSLIPTYLSPFDGYTHAAFAAITLVCLILDWLCNVACKRMRSPKGTLR